MTFELSLKRQAIQHSSPLRQGRGKHKENRASSGLCSNNVESGPALTRVGAATKQRGTNILQLKINFKKRNEEFNS